jgi:hypothetical protein
VLASIDQVPDELIDNAIILGVLSFVVAFLFLIDMSEKMGRKGKTDATQTDTSSIDRHFGRSLNIGTVNSELNLVEHDGNDRKRSVSQNQSVRSKASEVMNIQSNPMSLHSQSSSMGSQTQQQQQQQQQQYPKLQNLKQTQQPQSFNEFQNQHHQQHQQTPPQQQQQQQQSFGNSYHIHHSHADEENLHPSASSYVTEDVVQTKTYPTAQMPTFSKVKQYPTIVNHLEMEPYKKILNRSTQQSPTRSTSPYSRYQDQTPMHHENPTFYDDFAKYRNESYYQGPKVDQVGKLMVIRDYSSEKNACNCQPRDNSIEQQDDNVTVKSGYVSQVAKLWDEKSKANYDPAKIAQQRERDNSRTLNTHV